MIAYLRLHGVKAREHPVFTELTRVKQYFDKIKKIEEPPKPPTMALDKAAVGRIIKHGLVGKFTFTRDYSLIIAVRKR